MLLPSEAAVSAGESAEDGFPIALPSALHLGVYLDELDLASNAVGKQLPVEITVGVGAVADPTDRSSGLIAAALLE